MDLLPPGVSPPLVKPRSIDDVPILALTLWGAGHDDHQLRLLAGQLHDAIKEVPDVSEVTILGGGPRQVTVDLDPARLAAYDLDPLVVQRSIESANTLLPASRRRRRRTASDRSRPARGSPAPNRSATSWSGARRAARCCCGTSPPFADGDDEPSAYVTFHSRTEGAHPAVTIAVSKRKGTNAIDITHRVEQKLDSRARARSCRRRCTLTRHAQLRRDRAREVERAALAHAARRALGLGADLARARLAARPSSCSSRSRHARPHAVRLLPLRLHAEPHHALRAHLLDRHPGGRRDRRRGEHRAALRACTRRIGQGFAAIAVERSTRSATRPSSPRSRSSPRSCRWRSSAG